MNTHQKGLTGELKIVLRAQEKGWLVSKPYLECRYDLILDDGQKLYRAQVKYVNFSRYGAFEIPTESECRNNGYRHKYGDQVDVILAYLPSEDKIIWLDRERFKNKTTVSVRKDPPKNNQITLMLEEVIW